MYSFSFIQSPLTTAETSFIEYFKCFVCYSVSVGHTNSPFELRKRVYIFINANSDKAPTNKILCYMWTVTIDGACILLGAHIDDFVIACANRQVLDGFRARLLDAFEGNYEGALQHYPCEVTRDMDKGTTYLSQTHYAEKILRIYNFWNATPRLTPMQLNTHLNNDDYDRNPAPDFHRRYRGIVGSLGYLVTMNAVTLLGLILSSVSVCNFEERTTSLLPNTFCAIFAALGIKQFATLVFLTKTPTFCGVG